MWGWVGLYGRPYPRLSRSHFSNKATLPSPPTGDHKGCPYGSSGLLRVFMASVDAYEGRFIGPHTHQPKLPNTVILSETTDLSLGLEMLRCGSA